MRGRGVLPAALHPWKGGIPTASCCLQQRVGVPYSYLLSTSRGWGIPHCCHPSHRGGGSLAAAATLHVGHGSTSSHHLYVEKWSPNNIGRVTYCSSYHFNGGGDLSLPDVCDIKSKSLWGGSVVLTSSLNHLQ